MNESASNRRIPLWLKWVYSLMVGIVVSVYWHDLGPINFLWFSDIALILMALALWLESRLLASTLAVGVLLLELMWVADFALGAQLTGIALYMFDAETQWHIKLLSGVFHLALPPVLILMLVRYGYDVRALPAQIVLALVVLPLTYLVSDPADNINWVFGPVEPQQSLPPLAYLGLLTLTLIVLVYLPSHWLFKRFFPPR